MGKLQEILVVYCRALTLAALFLNIRIFGVKTQVPPIIEGPNIGLHIKIGGKLEILSPKP